MDALTEVTAALRTTLGVILYIAISYALPKELIQRSLRTHYREWIIASGAYWGRSYDKWIIGSRVFYTDEFWGDVLTSVLSGLVLGSLGTAALIGITGIGFISFLYFATSTSVTVLLFFLTQLDRIRLIDSELQVKKMARPSFDNELEIKKLLDGDRRFVKRVLYRSDLQP